LVRRKIEQELPKRNAACLRPEIETRIGERSEREMHHAFVWTEPTQLMMIAELRGDGAKIGHDVFDLASNQRQSE
jgi:hypothetical protein